MTDYHEMSDGELVRFAASHAGAPGAGATAELTRRDIEMQSQTRESLDALRAETALSSRRMETLTKWLVAFTVALVIMTAVIVWLTIAIVGSEA